TVTWIVNSLPLRAIISAIRFLWGESEKEKFNPFLTLLKINTPRGWKYTLLGDFGNAGNMGIRTSIATIKDS
ncbi:MAG: hypothetical protein GQ583_00940, partial [Methyloprofundus sp.]|nr:hypothetical protein [Methyloprofundus sp.]